MRFIKSGQGLLVAALVCAFPGILAAAPKGAVPAHPMAINQEENSAKTSFLLQRVDDQAARIRRESDEFASFLRFPVAGNQWQFDAQNLDNIRDDVNHLSELYSQLRADTSDDAPWERQAIRRTAPTAVNMVDTTEFAIQTMNRNRDHLYTSDLGGLVNDIYKDSRMIDRTVANFEKYASANQEAQQMRRQLQLKTNS